MLKRLLRRAARKRRIVLMDSGNYEAYWHHDERSWNGRKLLSVLRDSAFQLAFAFDELRPPRRVVTAVKTVESSVLRAQKVAGNGTVVPIVHGEKARLPSLVREVANRLAPILIAVPERELGDGLMERAATIAVIRAKLNELNQKYYCLHVLGTGNPLSILVYSICGADTFDGLEWCQTVADTDTARLYHFAHWDLFTRQCGLDLTAMPYPTRVLIHNLWFYSQWLDRVRWAVRTGHGMALVEEYLPKDAAAQVRDIVPSGDLGS
jgi:queuine/archaeosine tRNA-ribosyltransferase